MTKKDARDEIRNLIIMICAGKYKFKGTSEKMTLQNVPETVVERMNKLLVEKNISRKSVFKSIEAVGYLAGIAEANYKEKLQEMHDFCYTKLTVR